MHEPVEDKRKKERKLRLLQADAWIDSTLYEFFAGFGGGYSRFQDIMDRFHVYGLKRLLVEIVSDALSIGVIGLVLMTALALPAFDETASGAFNRQPDYSVIFLDRYGNEIGRRGIRTDDSFNLDQLPDYLVKATIATEDRRFYEHFGIDVWGTIRALVSNVQANSVVEGGSSITQQLAKNLFLSSERTLQRKINEAFLAIWLEAHYTKDEILKLYFDRAYMGGGNFGVAAASEFYFGKKVTDINLAEAAMLAGLFKAPSKYSPTTDLAAARGRANVVLSNMVDAGFLTEGQVTAARRNPAVPIDHSNDVNSPNYFLDWIYDRVKRVVAGSDAVGFIVHTTIDPSLQTYAEQAVTSTIRDDGERYHVSQGAMVVTDLNGAVRAMVGGVDYGKSQYNRAVNSERQPGSSFKPFVYATAFEELGMTPKTVIVDRPFCIGNWCPQNYERNFNGRISLLSALTHSVNTVAVQLSVKTGRQPIADMAHRLGITNNFPVTRSLALGVASVSVLDMASAYTAFADGGLKAPAYGITRITTLRGEKVFDIGDYAPHERVLDPEIVAEMNTMMRNVVVAGTGRAANIDGVPVAGKTGTTSSYRDAWFCGFTGNYVATVWLGNDDYTETKRVTGGSLPARTWHKFMQYAHTNIEIKPLFGVDFMPKPYVVAEGTDGSATEAPPERPPSLTPEAADKLAELADRLLVQMRKARLGNSALIAPASAPTGN
ncbi:MAG TPA: PBP1A family penicillin-binding protein [Devosiaceae bacterium]